MIVAMFRQSAKSLSSRKFRTFLTIIMVVIGLVLVTSTNGLTLGMEGLIRNQLNKVGADVINVTPSSTTSFNLNDMAVNRMQSIPGVLVAAPVIQRPVTIQSGGETRSVTVMGIDNNLLPLVFPQLEISEGTLLSSSDTTGVVLGSRLANPVDIDLPFAQMNSGVKLEVGTADGESSQATFLVRGIMEYVGSFQIDGVAFMSSEAAQNFFHTSNEYSAIYIIVEDPMIVEDVENTLIEMFGKNIVVLSPKSMAESIDQIFSSIELFYGLMTGISLLVATVGVIITLYTSVNERIREIGVLKSIGYTDGLVLSMFLVEAILIGLIGGTVGVLLGMGGAYILPMILSSIFSSQSGFSSQDSSGGPFSSMGGSSSDFFSSLTPVFEPTNILSFWLLAIVLSVIGGAYPAWRGSRLNPIDALRHE